MVLFVLTVGPSYFFAIDRRKAIADKNPISFLAAKRPKRWAPRRMKQPKRLIRRAAELPVSGFGGGRKAAAVGLS